MAVPAGLEAFDKHFDDAGDVPIEKTAIFVAPGPAAAVAGSSEARPSLWFSRSGCRSHRRMATARGSASRAYSSAGSGYTNADNSALDVIKSYTLGGAWVSWRSGDRKWEVQAWVKNFTDQVWRTHVYTQRGNRIAFGTFGPPRQYGLTLTSNY